MSTCCVSLAACSSLAFIAMISSCVDNSTSADVSAAPTSTPELGLGFASSALIPVAAPPESSFASVAKERVQSPTRSIMGRPNISPAPAASVRLALDWHCLRSEDPKRVSDIMSTTYPTE
ncbi:hypothetical protein Vretifemale_18392 [Volvox reticuliferus]|uniref:Secreted protein n=1 Tax=Volvox reticuliferus TaxID=1737510 RepID=A0A8J4FY06_9CHLO|nr:hypothetical protein Vretifemale_18392 [Volvox reticuliferus]